VCVLMEVKRLAPFKQGQNSSCILPREKQGYVGTHTHIPPYVLFRIQFMLRSTFEFPVFFSYLLSFHRKLNLNNVCM
jgi:hypothetical protein